jgi:hypothetical protein
MPLLLLFAAAVIVLLKYRETSALFPLAALAAVLLITLRVSYQVGTRHILVAVPLIAIVAGLGVGSLLQRVNWRSAIGAAVVALLVWQAAESASAQSGFLAYFNQLAGKDPSSVLVTGCDLDCGQDLFSPWPANFAPATRVNVHCWSGAARTSPGRACRRMDWRTPAPFTDASRSVRVHSGLEICFITPMVPAIFPGSNAFSLLLM